jgi:hypothetical protein
MLLLFSGCGGGSDSSENTQAPSDNENPKNSYIISSNAPAKDMVRTWNDGFDMDDIKVTKTNDSIQIENNSTRTILNPLLTHEGKFYQLKHELKPFTTVSFNWDKSTTPHFFDQMPLYKTKVKGITYEEGDVNSWGATSKEEGLVYHDLLPRHKAVSNRFEVNNFYFNEFLKDDDIAIRDIYTDQDLAVNAFFSRLAHKQATWHQRVPDYNSALGVASGGALAISGSRFKQYARLEFGATYEHERMHTHGYGHTSGLTYGWADLLNRFVWDSTRYGYPMLFEYGDDKLIKEETPLFSTMNWKESNDKKSLEVSFKFGSTGESMDLNRFVIASSDLNITAVYIRDSEGNILSNPTPSTKVTQKARTYEQNILIAPVYTLESMNTLNNQDELVVVVDANSTLTVNKIIINARGEDNEIHFNGLYNLEIRSALGIQDSDYNATIFLPKDEYGETMFLTPQEAVQFCKSKGLELGVMPAYKSREMIDLQYKYAKYETQVGISAEDGLATAVSVPTSYVASKITLTDKGELIICSFK